MLGHASSPSKGYTYLGWSEFAGGIHSLTRNSILM